MDLDNNAHSVFLLHYHLVLVKYRRWVFAEKEVAWWQTEHINSEYIPMMNRRFCLLRLLAVSEWCIIIGLIERSGSMRRTRQT